MEKNHWYLDEKMNERKCISSEAMSVFYNFQGDEKTVLHYACMRKIGGLDIVRHLLRSNANQNSARDGRLVSDKVSC